MQATCSGRGSLQQRCHFWGAHPGMFGMPSTSSDTLGDVQACIVRPKGDLAKALELLQAADQWACQGLEHLHMAQARSQRVCTEVPQAQALVPPALVVLPLHCM